MSISPSRLRPLVLAAALAATAMLALPSIASANDASMKRHLGGYTNALARDVGFLAGFTAPRSHPAAVSDLRKVRTARRHFAAVRRTAAREHPSSHRFRVGRSELYRALRSANAAAYDAGRSASAYRHRSTALHWSRLERRRINVAIGQLTRAGKALRLYG